MKNFWLAFPCLVFSISTISAQEKNIPSCSLNFKQVDQGQYQRDMADGRIVSFMKVPAGTLQRVKNKDGEWEDCKNAQKRTIATLNNNTTYDIDNLVAGYTKSDSSKSAWLAEDWSDTTANTYIYGKNSYSNPNIDYVQYECKNCENSTNTQAPQPLGVNSKPSEKSIWGEPIFIDSNGQVIQPVDTNNNNPTGKRVWGEPLYVDSSTSAYPPIYINSPVNPSQPVYTPMCSMLPPQFVQPMQYQQLPYLFYFPQQPVFLVYPVYPQLPPK